ncbi:MAG: hypothetical protein HKM05_07400 [Spirochaetales bacterium]|nr:hypothetical protein [Spirochaetales bacterium]
MKIGQLSFGLGVCLLGLTLPLSALDYGVTVENQSAVVQQLENAFTQYDKAAIWVRTDLGSNFRFDGQLSANLWSYTPHLYADFDQLSLTGTFTDLPGPRLLQVRLGRFFYADPSQRIVAQNLDGLQLAMSYPWGEFEATAGYTGLINKYYADPLMSKDDYADYLSNTDLFASPRLISALSVRFPELFLRQTPELTMITQTDLRPLFQTLPTEGTSTRVPPGQGGAVDTQYFGAKMSGPLGLENLFYSAAGYLGTGRLLTWENVSTAVSLSGTAYVAEPMLSGMVDGAVMYFAPQWAHSSLTLRYVWASGDDTQTSYFEGNTSGTATSFLPINGEPLGLVFAPQASNVSAFEVALTAKPFTDQSGLTKTLEPSMKVLFYSKPNAGPLSVLQTNATLAAGFLGTEVDAALNWRPTSDLGLSVQYGFFQAQPNVLTTKYSFWYLGQVLASFSF